MKRNEDRFQGDMATSRMDLRKQRNGAAAAAILLLAGALAVTLPHILFERKRLKTADDDLVSLQATITYVEGEIRETQRNIVKVQGELHSLSDEPKR